ncbi:MAG: penicillin-binding protein 1A [Gemmatimonadota bacterium]
MNWFKRHTKALLIGAVSLLLIAVVLWQRCGMRGCPDVDTLKGYMPDEASTLVDYQGQEIGKLFLTRRFIVPLDSLPEHVPNAFIAMEDKRFWDHGGVDWRRVLGAAWTNVKELGIEEGSSTITMQLARNAFPEKLPASRRTLWRKIAEARVARAIEKEYTKEEILQLYLNQIYFGNGAYGIEAAAQEYFGKPAAKLSLSEAATLAALPRAPSRLNPRHNRELALQGRKVVLERMAEQEMISEAEAAQAAKSGLKLRHGQLRTNGTAPYFVEAVRELLESELGDAIYARGYTIHTTLDARLQKILEQELTRQLRAVESGAYGVFRHRSYASARADDGDHDEGTKYLQSAAIFMDTKTGDVRALSGGRNFEDSQFNRALSARRQPGSAFKPFVYAAAFADGYSPTYRLMDRPLRLVVSGNQVWEPKNYDGGYTGAISMRDALTYSKNVATIRLANEIGLTRVIDMARQMGLGGRIPAVPAVVLGTAEVTPIEITSAFAAFANLGERPLPRFVTRVVDRAGEVVWSQPSGTQEVIDPAVAFMTVSLMQDVVNRGTGAGVRAAGYTGPAAGKTGTTNDAADIWFIGFTPDMIGTIWMGFDKRQTILSSATGGEIAAPVWGRVMRRAGENGGGWTPPPGIETRLVDANGNVLGENCPTVGATRREYFISGTAPLAECYSSYDSFTWNDSLYGYPDSAYYETERADDGWWTRLRSRIFGSEPEREPPPLDSGVIGQPVNPPPNPNPATQPPPIEPPKPKPVPYDSLVKPKLDSLPEVEEEIEEKEDSVILRL